ncbi:response regulator transcription factor [Shumkonia mesophila]|uniref:response regulator transcription factor n=1 Tax=Shumkonia mesophila TaxID=2838854 RepID=UPI002934B165|nr:response regulator transcription factor [Shumkonia mesophila]
MRILVVEDAADLAEAIVLRFRRSGHALDRAASGEEAIEFLEGNTYDLVILDIMLPGMDGYAVLRALRLRHDTTPVLVLTARAEIDDRVSALDIGADDYVTKPFDFRELEARARALLRRRQGIASGVTEHGNLTFDRSSRRVTVGGDPIVLPNREFRILEIFLGNLGRVITKDDITDQLYGFDDAPGPNAIELYIARLRKKLKGSSVTIRTLRGIGYVADLEG